MNKQLLFKIDNTIFNSDEELLKYVKKNFVSELEVRNTNLDEMIAKLQETFPDFKVTVENGKGWYCDYRIFISNDLMKFEEKMGNNNNPHASYDPNPETIEEIIDTLKNNKETVEYIITKVNNIGNFNIKCNRHSYGYSSNEESYEFVFSVNGEEHYSYYHPYNTEKDEFIKQFYQYVLRKLEGKLQIVYEDGYFSRYEIGGIPLGGFVDKKVRLETIE